MHLHGEATAAPSWAPNGRRTGHASTSGATETREGAATRKRRCEKLKAGFLTVTKEEKETTTTVHATDGTAPQFGEGDTGSVSERGQQQAAAYDR
jgi:hypothetical protein